MQCEHDHCDDDNDNKFSCKLNKETKNINAKTTIAEMMAEGRGKWMPFKSNLYDKFYGNESTVNFDILGINLKIIENFYTKFEEY